MEDASALGSMTSGRSTHRSRGARVELRRRPRGSGRARTAHAEAAVAAGQASGVGRKLGRSAGGSRAPAGGDSPVSDVLPAGQ